MYHSALLRTRDRITLPFHLLAKHPMRTRTLLRVHEYYAPKLSPEWEAPRCAANPDCGLVGACLRTRSRVRPLGRRPAAAPPNHRGGEERPRRDCHTVAILVSSVDPARSAASATRGAPRASWAAASITSARPYTTDVRRQSSGLVPFCRNELRCAFVWR